MVLVVVVLVVVVVEEGVRHRLTVLLLRCVFLRLFVQQGGRLGSLATIGIISYGKADSGNNM